MEKPGPGEKEQQVRALREARFKRRGAALKIKDTGGSVPCQQCAMYQDEIKRLKRLLAKAHGRVK